jgi:PPOX class probable F420-dependent enzyme
MTSIPESHLDLLERPVIVTLVTIMPNGQPQASPVWADVVDGHIRVNTVEGRQKHKNLRERKQATILVTDPEDSMRYIEVRGVVASETTEDGIEVIEKLSRDYIGKDYPWHNAADTRVTFRIQPKRVVTSG